MGWLLTFVLLLGGLWGWLGTTSRVGFPVFAVGLFLLIVQVDRLRARAGHDTGDRSGPADLFDDLIDHD